MAPTKPKAKKTRGSAIVAALAKRTGNAGKKKQVSANSGQCQHLRVAEEVASPAHDDVSLKLYALMKTMADLSSQMRDLPDRVEATEDCQRVVEASPGSLTTSRPTRRRARSQGSHVPDPGMAEEVQRCVVKRMRQLPTYSRAMIEEDFTSEEEDQLAPR